MSEIDREKIIASLTELDDSDKSFLLGYAVGACKAVQEKEVKKSDTDRAKKK